MRRYLLIVVLGLVVCPNFGQAQEKSDKKEAPAVAPVWGHIELHGGYPENNLPPGLFSELTDTLADTLVRFEKASTDPALKGLILRINNPSVSWGKLNELRHAIQKVRAAGKKVRAYLEEGGNADYLLASACDEVWMPESGILIMLGLRAEVGFYRNLFDKLDIKAEMLRVGEYKSAAEPYNRTEMSPQFREEMEVLMDDLFKQMIDGISTDRKIDPAKVRQAIDNGPLTVKAAQEIGLVTNIGYYDELEDAVRKEDGKPKIVRRYGKKKLDTDFSGFAGMVKMMDLMMGVEAPRRKSTANKLAIISAVGPIMSGKGVPDPFTGESVIGSDTMTKAIQQASEDDTVKAIVLRVDSPGGSALASDIIWRELERVKKPVVVSMGDVAASGGYYISMGADKIFAEPGTITGSIGVVGGKIALQGLFDKIGINTSIVARGQNSGALSTTTPFSDTERAAMQKMLNEIYVTFTTKAAQGRKMEVEKLEKLARGRIYSGVQAKSLGLIDEVGTLDDAMASAKQLAGLKPEDKLELLHLPKAANPFEALFGSLDVSAQVRQAQTAWYAEALDRFSPELRTHLVNMSTLSQLSRELRLVVLPYTIRIR